MSEPPSRLNRIAAPALERYRTDLSTLQLYSGNARTHDLVTIAGLLRAHGQYRALVYRTATREVVAGNGTMTAMLRDGWSSAAAIGLDLTEEEAARTVLKDNRLGELGRYDDAIRARLFREHPDLTGTGYGPGEVATLLAAYAVPDLGVAPADSDAALDDAARAFLTTDERRIVLVHARPTHEAFHAALAAVSDPGENAPAVVLRLITEAHAARN